MPSIRSLFLLGLPFVSIRSAEHPRQTADSAPNDFEALVSSLPEESVRSVLSHHLVPKYREGVFEHGKKAIEAVHHDDPQLATKLVDEAMREEVEKHELRRRQNSNTTESSTVVTTTSSTVVVKSSSTTTEVNTKTSTIGQSLSVLFALS
jgi:activator of HSP90 ATPase